MTDDGCGALPKHVRTCNFLFFFFFFFFWTCLIPILSNYVRIMIHSNFLNSLCMFPLKIICNLPLPNLLHSNITIPSHYTNSHSQISTENNSLRDLLRKPRETFHIFATKINNLQIYARISIIESHSKQRVKSGGRNRPEDGSTALIVFPQLQ